MTFLAKVKASLTIAVLCLVACSRPRIDPPLFTETSPTAAMLAAKLRAKEVGGVAFAVADTHSMEPVLRGGDWVTVQEVPFGSLKTGAIAVYAADWASSGTLVCHRLVQHDSEGWIASGDNVKPDIDETGRNRHSEASYRITPTNFVGLVVARYRPAQ